MSVERTNYEQEIVNALHDLDDEALRDVLGYLRVRKNRLKGEPGWLFLERTEHLHIDPEDLKLMEQAIEEDCERIDDEPAIEFPE